MQNRPSIARSKETEAFLDRVSGQGETGGDARTKQIVRRIVSDLFRTMEDFDVSPDEYWAAVSYLTRLGQSREVALLSPGLGFDHFLDLRMDAAEEAAGAVGGTPRTIEGPLYVAGAPVAKGEARLDDGSEEGEVLFMEGRVLDTDGEALPGATVEVWHADTKGNYSIFDPTQSKFNLRRTIVTDGEGRYRFRTIMPSGYACPPEGPTQQLLDALGRHGQRPAHIHFFVRAEGHRHLTTQINIADDPLVNDDFAFATRESLIPPITHHKEGGAVGPDGVQGPYATIRFDFTLQKAKPNVPERDLERERAAAAE